MCNFLKMVQFVNDRYNDIIVTYCSPFFRFFNLSHFWYYKLTNEGYFSGIGSHADWCEYFAAENFFLIYPQVRHPKFLDQKIHLHRDVQDQSLRKIYDSCAQKYGMKQSLVFVNRTLEGMEEFGFSTASLSEVQTSYFLNELPLFRYFIEKFRKENRLLFSKLDDNRVNLAKMVGSSFYQDPSPNSRYIERQALLQEMGVGMGNRLTEREVGVIRLLIQGYSAGKISSQIYLSRRTVEHHIERIKEKLGCHSKSELIQKVAELTSLGLLLI